MTLEQVRAALPSLLEQLALPAQARQTVEALAASPFLEDAFSQCRSLADPRLSCIAAARLDRELASQDADGFQRLALFLAAACLVRETYGRLGISDEVYFSTMGCFRRFLTETFQRTGRVAFTRSFWGWRQISCQMFRLGTLEFEYRLTSASEPLPDRLSPGQPILSVHIPSDAVLRSEELHASYRRAAAFWRQEASPLCYAGPPAAIFCGTWLLSPQLLPFLKEGSGIRQFASDYRLYHCDLQDDAFYEWLFDGRRDPSALPRRTALQRAVADHVARGGQIGSARGILELPSA